MMMKDRRIEKASEMADLLMKIHLDIVDRGALKAERADEIRHLLGEVYQIGFTRDEAFENICLKSASVPKTDQYNYRIPTDLVYAPRLRQLSGDTRLREAMIEAVRAVIWYRLFPDPFNDVLISRSDLISKMYPNDPILDLEVYQIQPADAFVRVPAMLKRFSEHCGFYIASHTNDRR